MALWNISPFIYVFNIYFLRKLDSILLQNIKNMKYLLLQKNTCGPQLSQQKLSFCMNKSFADLLLIENFQFKMHYYTLLPSSSSWYCIYHYVVLLFINNEALS